MEQYWPKWEPCFRWRLVIYILGAYWGSRGKSSGVNECNLCNEAFQSICTAVVSCCIDVDVTVSVNTLYYNKQAHSFWFSVFVVKYRWLYPYQAGWQYLVQRMLCSWPSVTDVTRCNMINRRGIPTTIKLKAFVTNGVLMWYYTSALRSFTPGIYSAIKWIYRKITFQTHFITWRKMWAACIISVWGKDIQL